MAVPVAYRYRKPALWSALIFLALNTTAMVFGVLWLNIIPFAVAVVLIALYRPDWLLLLIVVFTPLSLNLEELEELGGIGISLPTEPLILGLMLLYIFKIVSGDRLRRDFLMHPLTLAILINLGWMFLTTLTSTMPIVSLKFFLARMWFVFVMYFFVHRFLYHRRFIKAFIWCFIIPLTLVILYTIIHHATRSFTEESAHWVMNPFFKDHTVYGAILAMFFPLVVGFAFYGRRPPLVRLLLLGLFGLFCVALVLSYTRAAWVSLAAAGGVWLLIKLRIRFSHLMLVLGVLVGLFFLFQDPIVHEIEKNEQDSSDNLLHHVTSITNVSSDASNLERINRWNSALRMFLEKPILGFGPGTYMFQYAIYQKSSDRTIISTNLGEVGNAHSEYLGSLSESGILGTLTLLAIFIISISMGVRLYYSVDDAELKRLVMGILLGLITYYIHGLLNNYLDTDKASVPVWGFLSILVAIDLMQRRQKNLQQSKAVSSK